MKGLCGQYNDGELECCLNTNQEKLGVWIGMYDEENRYNQTFFKHSSGLQPTYTNWAINQPDIRAGKCVSIHKNDEDFFGTKLYAGQWKVSQCNFKYRYMCKKNVVMMAQTNEVQVPGCPKVILLDEYLIYLIHCIKY